MAIVETDSESDSETGALASAPCTSIHTSTTALLTSLHIPQEYVRFDPADMTADVLSKLDEWKAKALQGLKGLRAKIEELRSRKSEDTEAMQDEKDEEGDRVGIEWGEDIQDEDVVWNVARFRQWGTREEWTNEEMSEIAGGTSFLSCIVIPMYLTLYLLTYSLPLSIFTQTSLLT